MYQVIEYNDYRKENYIKLHGVTSDLERAKQRAQQIFEIDPTDDKEDCFVQIYELPKDHCADYVYLSDRKAVMHQYSCRKFTFSKLLNKTIEELFEIIEERVPKTLSPDQIITKEVFRDLIHRKVLNGYLNFLHEDTGDISMEIYSTVVAIVKCEEF